MEFFENGFLSSFQELFHSVTMAAFHNFAFYAVVAILALEVSRRISKNGTTLAFVVIAIAALYATGATTLFVR